MLGANLARDCFSAFSQALVGWRFERHFESGHLNGAAQKKNTAKMVIIKLRARRGLKIRLSRLHILVNT